MLVVEVNYNYMLKLSNNDSFPSSIVISIIVTVRGPLAVQFRRIDIQYSACKPTIAQCQKIVAVPHGVIVYICVLYLYCFTFLCIIMKGSMGTLYVTLIVLYYVIVYPLSFTKIVIKKHATPHLLTNTLFSDHVCFLNARGLYFFT